MMICFHRKKYHEIKNEEYEECFGYHLTEYDVYCSKCGKELGHYAYGSFEPEFEIRYVLKGFTKIYWLFKWYILKKY